MQPLEISDFSGGLTENYLQGDPRRYQYADNLLITIDKKLRQRQGFNILGSTSYYIPSANFTRINGLFAVHNEDVVLAEAGRDIFYLNASSVWTAVTGMGAHPALQAGDVLSQTTAAEFQRVVYLTSDDGNGIQPSKVFQDTTGAWIARTAGLPRSYVIGNYSDSSLLAKCIVNANLLRASIVAHISDAASTVYSTPTSYQTTSTNLHLNIDRFALSYLATQTFGPDTNIPSPLPTPAPAATNQATLFTLVYAMNQAYSAHVGDAMLNSWGTRTLASAAVVAPRYHQDMPVFLFAVEPLTPVLQKSKGPGAPLTSAGLPTTLVQAAAMLDDLWQKWNWHRLSVNTHDQFNNYARINLYAPSGSKIGTIQEGNTAFPTITSNWSDVIGYVNNLRYMYNYHVLNLPDGSYWHKQRDNSSYKMQNECTLPEATDLDSTYLTTYWLRSLYQMHSYDAALPGHVGVSFTATSGSATLSSCTFTTGGATVTGSTLAGQFIYIVGQSASLNGNTYLLINSFKCALITGGTAGNITLDHTMITSGTGTGQVSSAMYHSSLNTTSFGLVDASGSTDVAANDLSVAASTVGTSTKTWLTLATDLFFALANHMNYGVGHVTTQWTTQYQAFITSVPYGPFFQPTSEVVSYAMFFSDDYVVEPNGIEYLVLGNPTFSPSTEISVPIPVGSIPTNLYPTYYTAQANLVEKGTTLTNLPVLVNDGASNYAVSNVKLNIYRTTDGGTTYFLLAQLSNGTTSYVDVINDLLANPGDTALNTRQNMYTSGGVVGFDQPPVSKYAHNLDGTVYWGGVTDTGQFFPNRVRQSIKGAPDAAPASFFDDLDSPVTGLSSARGNLIVFCQQGIYRMAGQFTSTGTGALTHENIGDTLGNLNAKGIVRTEIGVFFPGTDGFYYTDGYQVIPITLELKKTYAALTASDTQKRKIAGAYDRLNRRILWAMCEDETGAENTVIYAFYLDYGVKPSGTFTVMRNDASPTQFMPASLVFQKGQLIYGHGKGYLLKYDALSKYDILVDTTTTANNWQRTYVPWNFVSTAVDMGSTAQRKYVTKMHVVAQNSGNMAIQPYLLRDLNQYGQGALPLAPINYLENMTWGDSRPVWGDPTVIWKLYGKMDVKRRFPRKALRSDYLQVQFKPSTAIVYSSSQDYPSFAWVVITAGSGTDKVLTLQTPSGYTAVTFPLDVLGYTVRLPFDAYVADYAITRLNGAGTAITVADPANALPLTASPGVQWEIWGIKREQMFSLSSVTVNFAYLGDENQTYPGPNTGDGPGNAGGNPT